MWSVTYQKDYDRMYDVILKTIRGEKEEITSWEMYKDLLTNT